MLFARFSIGLKLLILSTLPLLLLVVLLFNEGKSFYETTKNSHQTEVVTKFALELDNIAHQHALERGLTASFLSSNGTKNKDEILKQRKKVDQSVNQLSNYMSTHQRDLQNINTNAYELIDLLKQTKIVRGKVDHLRNDNNAFDYYSSVNKKTIDTIYRLTTFVEDNSLRSELNSMVLMLWLKERTSQSRGALNGVYSKGTVTIEVYTQIYTFIKDFDNRLELLINSRTFHTKAALIELVQLPFFAQINTIQNAFLSQSTQLNNIQGPTPEQWFPQATRRIEAIKAIVDDQVSYTLNESNQTLAQSQRFLIVSSIIIISFILGLIFLSYYISYNISSRILNIDTLLTSSINKNDLSTKIDVQGNDEISHIAKGINSYIGWLKEVVSDVEENALEYEYLANHDPLTKLANRSLFFSRLTHLTEQLHRYDRHHAILYIDLDFFKKINDEYGHIIGDKVLKKFATILDNKVRTTDTVARIGGDEFAVILEEITPDKAHLVLQKLLEEMETPFLIDNLMLNISISIGMTIFPNEAPQNATVLLKQADHALYVAKRSGRRQYQNFDKALKIEYEENTQLEIDLEHAIGNQEIFPYFQPQYCLHTHKIVGLEALARWQHPKKGFIPLNKFIPFAEKLSLITLLTESIMMQVSTNLSSFIDIVPDLKIAINISGSECSNPHILHLTQKLIKENHIKPEQIELEITESVLIDKPEFSIDMLTALHDLGVRIAIDDFGTSYSSLSYLTALPIDVLKIDMSFVQGIGINPQQEIVIKVIIDLAKRLSLKVLAEGIETQAQADFLVENGCDYAQGYFYSKPCSPQHIIELLDLNHLEA
jgi:diguanylate cyclase (GGDEF)-like protein